MKKQTVFVAIAAYNSQNNIKKLLRSLVKQRQSGFSLHKIVVYSDASSDMTVSEAKKVNDSRIQVIDGTVNKGFANAVKYLLGKSRSDYTILLNDDIKIKNNSFILEIVKAFQSEENVGLVSGNIQPIKGSTFVEHAMESSFNVYEKLRNSIRSGNNIYTCDGKILAFSKKFKDSIRFPKQNGSLGNVDNFMYLMCLHKGFLYKNARNAIVYYKNFDNVYDYINFYIRIHSVKSFDKKFGKLLKKEYEKPRFKFVLLGLLEMLKNPVGALFVLSVSQYVWFKTRKASDFNPKWTRIESTKL